jgi:hypothetical protein
MTAGVMSRERLTSSTHSLRLLLLQAKQIRDPRQRCLYRLDCVDSEGGASSDASFHTIRNDTNCLVSAVASTSALAKRGSAAGRQRRDRCGRAPRHCPAQLSGGRRPSSRPRSTAAEWVPSRSQASRRARLDRAKPSRMHIPVTAAVLPQVVAPLPPVDPGTPSGRNPYPRTQLDAPFV